MDLRERNPMQLSTLARLGAVALLALAGATETACSEDSDQCSTDADCASRGNFVCSAAKVCVAKDSETPPVVVVTPEPTNVACESTEKCTDENNGLPSICRKPGVEPCLKLDTPDCHPNEFGPYEHVQGDWKNPDAVFIGMTMYYDPDYYFYVRATKSVAMALNDIAQNGPGLPPETEGGPRRPIVTVHCNSFEGEAQAVRSAKFLVETLKVPVFMPAWDFDARPSFDTFVKNKALGVCPECIESFWTGYKTEGYFRTMSPNNLYDPEVMAYLGELAETKVRAERGLSPSAKIKVAFLSTSNVGDISYLEKLKTVYKFNGVAAKDNGDNLLTVTFDEPDNAVGEVSWDPLGVAEQVLAFKPDVVIVASNGGMAFHRIPPLIEGFWPSSTPRPQYISGRGAVNLYTLDFVGQNEELRERVVGVQGALASPPTVDDEFQARYKQRYSGERSSSVGLFYDSVMATYYAAVAAKAHSGEALRDGFGKLGSGVKFTTAPQNIFAAVSAITTAGGIDLQNRYGSTRFDSVTGLFEGAGGAPYCVSREAAGGPVDFYTGASLRYDPGTGKFSGTYSCPATP